MGPMATRGALEREPSGMKPMRLDSARHVRELTEMDLCPCRFFERALEVRVVKGFGIAALPAIAKSPNCNAGDGTAELRQVLSGKLGFPEPPVRGGFKRIDRLAAFINRHESLAAKVFVRKGTGALAGEVGELWEITAQSLVFTIGGAMRAAVVVDERHPADGALERRAFPEAGSTRILDDDIASVPSGGADEPTADVEKVAKTLLFFLVMPARIIGDGFGGARNAQPEYADNAGAEPPTNKTLDSGIGHVEGWATFALKGRGDAAAEGTNGRREPAPAGKEFEKVAARRKLGRTRHC